MRVIPFLSVLMLASSSLVTASVSTSRETLEEGPLFFKHFGNFGDIQQVNEKRLSAANIATTIGVATAIYRGLKGNGYVKEAEEMKEALQLEGRDFDEGDDETVERLFGRIFGSREATNTLFANL